MRMTAHSQTSCFTIRIMNGHIAPGQCICSQGSVFSLSPLPFMYYIHAIINIWYLGTSSSASSVLNDELGKETCSRIPHTIRTDTQGCGVGLADTKLSPFIDITLFDTETQKASVHISIEHNDSLSLICILY